MLFQYTIILFLAIIPTNSKEKENDNLVFSPSSQFNYQDSNDVEEVDKILSQSKGVKKYDDCSTTISTYREFLNLTKYELPQKNTLSSVMSWYKKYHKTITKFKEAFRKLDHCQNSSEFLKVWAHFSKTFDEKCLDLFDGFSECAHNFTESLATNMKGSYQNVLRKSTDSDGDPYVDFKGYISPDQKKEIDSICEGTVMNCFQSILNNSSCHGTFRYKFCYVSRFEFYEVPYTFFRCNTAIPEYSSAGNLKFGNLFLILIIIFI
ncbi:hypothetical protein ACFFRR_004643 [Megaselia abdita]